MFVVRFQSAWKRDHLTPNMWMLKAEDMLKAISRWDTLLDILIYFVWWHFGLSGVPEETNVLWHIQRCGAELPESWQWNKTISRSVLISTCFSIVSGFFRSCTALLPDSWWFLALPFCDLKHFDFPSILLQRQGEISYHPAKYKTRVCNGFLADFQIHWGKVSHG